MASQGETQELYLDPAIRDWVLIPIMLIMVFVGVLRHYVTLMLQSTPKPNLKALREKYVAYRFGMSQRACS
jgi:hypothetical protein